MLGMDIPQQFATPQDLIDGLKKIVETLENDDSETSGFAPTWTMTGDEE